MKVYLLSEYTTSLSLDELIRDTSEIGSNQALLLRKMRKLINSKHIVHILGGHNGSSSRIVEQTHNNEREIIYQFHHHP